MKVVNEEYKVNNNWPEFSTGDTITVHYKIKEGNKERVQNFRGVVIQRRGSGHSETFTVRKMSGNIGVERIFPMASPFIEKIDVNKKGRVRRSRIFYIRGLTGKKARIQEQRKFVAKEEQKTEPVKEEVKSATTETATKAAGANEAPEDNKEEKKSEE